MAPARRHGPATGRAARNRLNRRPRPLRRDRSRRRSGTCGRRGDRGHRSQDRCSAPSRCGRAAPRRPRPSADRPDRSCARSSRHAHGPIAALAVAKAAPSSPTAAMSPDRDVTHDRKSCVSGSSRPGSAAPQPDHAPECQRLRRGVSFSSRRRWRRSWARRNLTKERFSSISTMMWSILSSARRARLTSVGVVTSAMR
jgi:hypothetical protein